MALGDYGPAPSDITWAFDADLGASVAVGKHADLPADPGAYALARDDTIPSVPVYYRWDHAAGWLCDYELSLVAAALHRERKAGARVPAPPRWPFLTQMVGDQLDAVERVLAKGAGGGLWRKGPARTPGHHLAKALKHALRGVKGATDPDSGEPHQAHAVSRILLAMRGAP